MGQLIVADSWDYLRRFTRARIALGRTGVSLPTREVLQFSLAHAQARDAVHLPLDAAALSAQLLVQGFAPLAAHSAAPDRTAYLRRPDWGRRLDEASRQALRAHGQQLAAESVDRTQDERPVDIAVDALSSLSATPASAREGAQPAGSHAGRLVLIVADGLSSLAVARHAPPLLAALAEYLPDLAAMPLVIARQARVALGDEIGELLGAEQVVVLIGERPGLSSPDSLGIYLTHAPRIGRNDAERNCISNVRPEGLDYANAARKLAYLIAGARRLGGSGVALKDDSDVPLLATIDEDQLAGK
jgi:ethanolamine ammonia-lyase small subunit